MLNSWLRRECLQVSINSEIATEVKEMEVQPMFAIASHTTLFKTILMNPYQKALSTKRPEPAMMQHTELEL